jgi:hypothetical protein
MEDKIITEEELENALKELHVLSNNIIVVLRKLSEGTAHIYEYDEAINKYESYKNNLFRRLGK